MILITWDLWKNYGNPDSLNFFKRISSWFSAPGMVAFIHDDFTPVQSVVILRLWIACKWMKGTSIESHVYPTLAYGNLS